MKQIGKGKASSMASGLMAGTMASMSVTVVLAAILGKMIEREQVLWENAGYGIVILVIVSAYTGTTVAINRIKSKKVIVWILSGGIYFLSLISITAMFFGGEYEAVGVTGALILAGSTVSVLMKSREGAGKGKKIKIGYHR